jgi:predicted RNase H-like HicB family nuclease
MTSELIREMKIQGKDGEGKPETATIRITRTDDGFEVDWLVDDVIADSTTCDTRAEAEKEAREWAITMLRDYQENERELKAQIRRERREELNDIADEFAGDDARALRMIAAIIGQGRSKAAVEALRAINQRRRRDR